MSIVRDLSGSPGEERALRVFRFRADFIGKADHAEANGAVFSARQFARVFGVGADDDRCVFRCAHVVDRDDRVAVVTAVESQRLHDEQTLAFEAGVFDSSRGTADDLGDLHFYRDRHQAFGKGISGSRRPDA